MKSKYKINKKKLLEVIYTSGFDNVMCLLAKLPLSQSSFDKFNREGWPPREIKAMAYELGCKVEVLL